jgi:hypothetical protein
MPSIGLLPFSQIVDDWRVRRQGDLFHGAGVVRMEGRHFGWTVRKPVLTRAGKRRQGVVFKLVRRCTYETELAI